MVVDKNPKLNSITDFDKLYMDLHFYLDMPDNLEGLEKIIDHAMERIDIIAVTGRGNKREESNKKRNLLS